VETGRPNILLVLQFLPNEVEQILNPQALKCVTFLAHPSQAYVRRNLLRKKRSEKN
jgi:hypothetical protein